MYWNEMKCIEMKWNVLKWNVTLEVVLCDDDWHYNEGLELEETENKVYYVDGSGKKGRTEL